MAGAPNATAFPSLSVTVPWCPQEPYVNGYVYTSGALAPGSQCWAPLVEVRNGLCVPAVLYYESRVPEDETALCNRQVLAPKGHALLTGLLPSLPGFPSKIRVEDADGHVQAFTLQHSPTYGYYVAPADECAYEAPNGPRRGCIELEGSAEPYVPRFCGCRAPYWKDTVIVPLRIRALRPEHVGDAECAAAAAA